MHFVCQSNSTLIYSLYEGYLSRFTETPEIAAQNPTSWQLLPCLSRPTHAFTVRKSTENGGRGALNAILEESARREEKTWRIRGLMFRYWVRHDKKTLLLPIPAFSLVEHDFETIHIHFFGLFYELLTMFPAILTLTIGRTGKQQKKRTSTHVLLLQWIPVINPVYQLSKSMAQKYVLESVSNPPRFNKLLIYIYQVAK